MQANMLSSEYDEISDMHKKVLRVSARFILHIELVHETLLFSHRGPFTPADMRDPITHSGVL